MQIVEERKDEALLHNCYRYIVFNALGDYFMEARENVHFFRVVPPPSPLYGLPIVSPISLSALYHTAPHRGCQPQLRHHLPGPQGQARAQHPEGTPVLRGVLPAHLLLADMHCKFFFFFDVVLWVRTRQMLVI